VGQTYCDGSKESERPAVRKLLTETNLCSQKITLDALHLVPKTVSTIHDAEGIYLIGLKSNQAHLYRYCICKAVTGKADYEQADEPKRAHGRLEQRSYASYSLPADALASGWGQRTSPTQFPTACLLTLWPLAGGKLAWVRWSWSAAAERNLTVASIARRTATTSAMPGLTT